MIKLTGNECVKSGDDYLCGGSNHEPTRSCDFAHSRNDEGACIYQDIRDDHKHCTNRSAKKAAKKRADEAKS